ncbi:MAG: glycosyltransferase [Kiritimatiellae bacterium]|nr:glycosyltransferase [Kiritimatiellia bacterium]
MKIHQIVAGYRKYDAISDVANLMQRIFRSWGHRSGIYCASGSVAPESRGAVCDIAGIESDLAPSDVAILHLSIGCEANLVFRRLKCRKAIIYHNITPPGFFELTNRSTAATLAEGRRQMAELAGCADVNLADSAFNAAELTAAGYRDVRVFPLPIDLDRFAPGAFGPKDVLFDHSGGDFNILFVGRFAPNKKIEDLVKVFHYLSKIEPRARLFHIGAMVGMEAYSSIVTVYAEMLRLQRVHFLDVVTQEGLNAAYANADAFLCMSEHEGFCAPLVEAMLHGVPVFALATSAVPETLGGAGVLFEAPPDYPVIAETVSKVLNTPRLRAAILRRQEQRLAEIRSRDISAELAALLKPIF